MSAGQSLRARAVIFDLDGTLLDTLDDLADAVNHVLDTLDCPTHPVDAYRRMVGDGAPTLIRRALPAEQVDALHGVAYERFREYYGAHSRVKTGLYPGIAPLLDELESLAVPKSIVSNKPHAPTVALAAEVFGRWRFEAVSGHREEVPKKPDPAMALEAARAMNVPAEACLFVGDSGVDVRTGQSAGMTTVGVSWGFRGREELEAEGATAVIDEPRQLLEWF